MPNACTTGLCTCVWFASPTLPILPPLRIAALKKALTPENGVSIPEAQRVQLREVIRSYQDEVEALTSRSVFSEDAFLFIYRSLLDAPDPAIAYKELAVSFASTNTSFHFSTSHLVRSCTLLAGGEYQMRISPRTHLAVELGAAGGDATTRTFGTKGVAS